VTLLPFLNKSFFKLFVLIQKVKTIHECLKKKSLVFRKHHMQSQVNFFTQLVAVRQGILCTLCTTGHIVQNTWVLQFMAPQIYLTDSLLSDKVSHEGIKCRGWRTQYISERRAYSCVLVAFLKLVLSAFGNVASTVQVYQRCRLRHFYLWTQRAKKGSANKDKLLRLAAGATGKRLRSYTLSRRLQQGTSRKQT